MLQGGSLGAQKGVRHRAASASSLTPAIAHFSKNKKNKKTKDDKKVNDGSGKKNGSGGSREKRGKTIRGICTRPRSDVYR